MISKLIDKLSVKAKDVAFRIGLLKPDMEKAGGLRIIVYHGVDTAGRKDINARFISAFEFEEQIKFYREHFNLVSLEDCFQNRLSKDKFNICITFDDGYRNNFINALPILEKYKSPATIFITTIRAVGLDILWSDFLDLVSLSSNEEIIIDEITYCKVRGEYRNRSGERLKQIAKTKPWSFKEKIFTAFDNPDFKSAHDLKEYWEILSEEEIKSITAHPLITLGTHGMYHNNLDTDISVAKSELWDSKNWLERISAKQINAVAFPDGAVSKMSVDVALDCGYNQLLAANSLSAELKNEQKLLPRFTINPFISLPYQIHCIIQGSYN